MEFIDDQNVTIRIYNWLMNSNEEKSCKYIVDGVYLYIKNYSLYKIIELKKDDMTLYSVDYDHYSYFRRVKK